MKFQHLGTVSPIFSRPLDLLWQYGSDYTQSYHFAPPKAGKEFQAWMAMGRRR